MSFRLFSKPTSWFFLVFGIFVFSVNSLKAEPVFQAPSDFYFGLAGAPAHQEDNLDDIWLDFAKKGGVAAFWQAQNPQLRLNFWSRPEQELDLVQESGVQVYRMGIDWGRVMPIKPTFKNGLIEPDSLIFNLRAIEHYKHIISLARQRNLRVMLSLFHHSVPKWMIKEGGWKSKKSIAYFVAFATKVIDEFKHLIDDWITLNEPAVYAVLTYAGGVWPPGGKQDNLAFLRAFGVKGSFKRAVDHMVIAHKQTFSLIKKLDRVKADGKYESKVGIAHNVALYTANKFTDALAKKVVTYNLVDEFPNKVIGYLDFLGINYYGEEIVTGTTVVVDGRREYSESGRTINPTGLFSLIYKFHKRYNLRLVHRNVDQPNYGKTIPFVITENGISDATDILRPSYLIEHLKAIQKLISVGVPINGYIFWTVSDNWEWADGYCPKFGFFEVDRSNRLLTRRARPSFFLFKKIVKTRKITVDQAKKAWNLVESNFGNLRPFCRSKDGKTSANTPYFRPFVEYDWRFKSLN